MMPLVTGIAYCAFGWGALYLTQGADGIATIWPPSGILLAALLMTTPGRAPAFVAAAAVASMAANLLGGLGTTAASVLTIANMVEMLPVWLLLRGGGRTAPDFLDPFGIVRFCGAAVAATATSAAFATAFGGIGTLRFALSWFLTDLLGMLIVTPVVMLTADAIANRHAITARRRREMARLLTVVAAVAVAVFSQSTYPLLFLPMAALLATTYRLGTIGAGGGVLVIAIIATAFTANGHGPVMLIRGDVATMAFFLQFYLIVLLGTALPLATRSGRMHQVKDHNRLLALAERTAQLGHWNYDVETGRLFWSPEVFRLYGLPPGMPPPLPDAIQAYHPDDRDAISALVDDALAGKDGGRFGFEARLMHSDGTVRYVVSRGHADHDEDGTLVRLFGILQDVSDRVRTQQALERARALAEAAADTDALTGLASRRRALRVLDTAMAGAVPHAPPLSVAIFDVDHFKAINDRFGHVAGDGVLCRIAQAAVAASRKEDLIGRLGGEEFILLLPGTDAATAMVVAERVRAAIDASGENEGPHATISIGVAQMDADASSTALLKRADDALYDAKRAGRNRLRLAA